MKYFKIYLLIISLLQVDIQLAGQDRQVSTPTFISKSAAVIKTGPQHDKKPLTKEQIKLINHSTFGAGITY